MLGWLVGRNVDSEVKQGTEIIVCWGGHSDAERFYDMYFGFLLSYCTYYPQGTYTTYIRYTPYWQVRSIITWRTAKTECSTKIGFHSVSESCDHDAIGRTYSVQCHTVQVK